jgi:acetyl esterase/lipase
VLHYSVGVAALEPAPTLEGFSAIVCIRDHAVEWNVDPDQIVVCGFSAGGHLASCLMTMWKDAALVEAMGRLPTDLRPDAGILCYALLKMPYEIPPVNTGMVPAQKKMLIAKLKSETREPQHPDWMRAIYEEDGFLWLDTAAIAYLNCFGTMKPSPEQIQQYSTILHIDRDTPPAFLWCTAPDDIVPASNSIDFTSSMLVHGRPVELHVFGSGGHGLSLAKTITGSLDNLHPARHWFELAMEWLNEILKSPDQTAKLLLPEEKERSSRGNSDRDEMENPTQYYKNIYNDRASMFRHVSFSL